MKIIRGIKRLSADDYITAIEILDEKALSLSFDDEYRKEIEWIIEKLEADRRELVNDKGMCRHIQKDCPICHD